MKKLILILLLVMPLSAFATEEADEAQVTSQTEESAADTSAESDEADQKPNLPDLAGTVSQKVVCKLNSDEREISIVKDPEGPSSVVYKKAGEEKTVAYAQNDSNYVERVAEKIKANLESASFTCETAE